VIQLLEHPTFTAGAAAALAAALLLQAARTGVIRHPLDPIGASPSAFLRLIYLLLLVPLIAAMVLVAWRLSRPTAAAL
jgi:hypothetical protein